MMTFWALENADDATIIMFGCLVIVVFSFMGVIVLIDWIKNITNGRR